MRGEGYVPQDVYLEICKEVGVFPDGRCDLEIPMNLVKYSMASFLVNLYKTNFGDFDKIKAQCLTILKDIDGLY